MSLLSTFRRMVRGRLSCTFLPSRSFAGEGSFQSMGVARRQRRAILGSEWVSFSIVSWLSCSKTNKITKARVITSVWFNKEAEPEKHYHAFHSMEKWRNWFNWFLLLISTTLHGTIQSMNKWHSMLFVMKTLMKYNTKWIEWRKHMTL